MSYARWLWLVLLAFNLVACGDDDDDSGGAPPHPLARRITDQSDLIGGPLAVGRVGDYLLANDRIRAIIKQPGRDLSFLLTYGGNIVDADIVRPAGEPGRDNFGAMTPLINVSSTVNVQEITVVNDGANGEPAVIRTVGRDDLLDAIDPNNAISSISGGAVGLPPSAIDNDIPVQVMTDFSLPLGADAIRIETTILNEGDEELTIYIGDYVNSSGELDTFAPSFGFGEIIFRPVIPYLAYPQVGETNGITYGIVPLPIPDTPVVASGFGQAGFFAYLLGQDILNVLLTGEPGIAVIAPGETQSYVRYFVVSDGDVGSIAAIQQELVGTAIGEISGRVTVNGEPAAGAHVSVVQTPGVLGAPFNVVTAMRTDDAGNYRGTAEPGEYAVMAKLFGYRYDSGTTTPNQYPVTVAEGATATVDIEIPDTGRLVVSAADQSGNPLPAKLSLVGFDQAPDPGNHTVFAIVSIDGFVFASDIKNKGAELYGLAGVHFIDATGTTGMIEVPPGEYEVVVSRGTEYSDHRQRVVIRSGQTTAVDSTLVRVIDTPGFVSGDHHVHLINSLDSAVTREERLGTMAAEGVEYFVATDHDFITDLRDDLRRSGLADFLSVDIGAEITSFNFGHFNAWPLTPQPDRVGGGPIDWGRAGVPPGMDYPSAGSYELSPAELFPVVRDRLRFGADESVIQINHFNGSMLGFFHIAGIDTALDPPQSSVDPSLIRQDPALTNLYDDGYTALEVWIEANRNQTALFLEANLGDWFNLLNQGRIKAGMADSDTHHTAIIQAGGPRTFLASPTDDPSDIRAAALAASVNQGRLIGTSGPFVQITIEGDGGAQGGHDLDLPTLVPATTGTVTIRVDIQSPLWAEFDRIEVYANTVPIPVPDEGPHGITVPRYTVEPAIVLDAGTDFDITHVAILPPPPDTTPLATRLEADVEIPLSIETDTWVVVLVKGTDGVSRPMWPMNPQDLEQDSNQTLDDLTDGNLGEGGNPGLAFTNPLYLDYDGNGTFDPSMELP
jgi:hypothetical protein